MACITVCERTRVSLPVREVRQSAAAGESEVNENASIWICVDGRGVGGVWSVGMRHQELCADADAAADRSHRPTGQKTADNNRQIHDVNDRRRRASSRRKARRTRRDQNAQNASQAAECGRRGRQRRGAPRRLAGQRGEGPGQLQAGGECFSDLRIRQGRADRR